MPLSPITYPPLLSLAENPVVFGFRSNNYLSSVGSYAALVITIPALTTGTSFTLTFLGRTITFTAAANPDHSGTQYPAPGTSISAWAVAIANALYGNYYISANYNITYGTNFVRLTAKQKGPDYNITGASSSFTMVSIVGSNQTQRPFFQILSQILSDGKLIGTDIRPVDTSGRAWFDFSEYLRAHFSANPGTRFSFQENVSDIIIPRPELLKSYIVRHAEYYGDEPEPKKLTSITGYYVIPGGVPARVQARYNELNSNFWHNIKTKKQFLTWHPNDKRTAADEIQKLYFIVTKAVTITLMARINYRESDGTNSQTSPLTKKTIGAGAMFMVEICCAYNRLQLDVDATSLPAGSTVTGYDLWLIDDLGNVISEVRSFIIDPKYYQNRRTFLFRNSLGVFETFISTGDGIADAEYTRHNINTARNWDFTLRAPDHANALNYESQLFTTNSGWVSEDVINWLRDLQLSREVYEVRDDQLFPVMFTGSKIAISQDNNYLYNMQLEYVHAFTDEHYALNTGILIPRLPYAIITNKVPPQSKPQPTITPPIAVSSGGFTRT